MQREYDGHTMFGRWSEEGVPHKGWKYVVDPLHDIPIIEDLGTERVQCGMCLAVWIRFAHHLVHPDFPERLIVGCTCAENMTDDYVEPRKRERALATRSRRDRRWQKLIEEWDATEGARYRQLRDEWERQQHAALQRKWADIEWYDTHGLDRPWRYSRNGKPYSDDRGLIRNVFQTWNGKWKYRLGVSGGYGIFRRKEFATMEDAMTAALKDRL